MVVWTDLRTKAGKERRPMALAKAAELRARGLRFDQIAPIVGVNPATLSVYTPLHLVHLDPLELADARYAHTYGLQAADVTTQRREEQRARWLWRSGKSPEQIAEKRLRQGQRKIETLRMQERRREIERAHRGQRNAARLALRQQRERERQEARWHRQAQSHLNRLAHSPASLDAPLAAWPELTLGDAIPASGFDPQEMLEQEELHEILGGLSLDDVDRLNEETLEHYREKLRDAGYAGLGRHIKASERERLEEPEPHRGVSGRPERLALPAEDDEADLLLRGTGSRKDRRALAQSRKARGDFDQAKLRRNRGKHRHRWRGYNKGQQGHKFGFEVVWVPPDG